MTQQAIRSSRWTATAAMDQPRWTAHERLDRLQNLTTEALGGVYSCLLDGLTAKELSADSYPPNLTSDSNLCAADVWVNDNTH